MIHNQADIPKYATVGDSWVHPNREFKRVLSRGGAWENVTFGTRHPDEVDDEQSTQPETEQRNADAEVSSGTGESTPRDGDDGEATDSTDDGEENPGVIADEPAGHEGKDDVSQSGEPLTSTGPLEGDHTHTPPDDQNEEGIDGNGSPVV